MCACCPRPPRCWHLAVLTSIAGLCLVAVSSWRGFDEVLQVPADGSNIAALVRMLQYVDSTFTAARVRYCITAGTLLAATRGGVLLPWDSDIDVRVPDADLDGLHNFTRQLPASAGGYLHEGCVWDIRAVNLTDSVQLFCDGNSLLHIDVVLGSYYSQFWPVHDYLFSERTRTVNLSGVAVSAPSAAMTKRSLLEQYGASWQNPDVYTDVNSNWRREAPWRGPLRQVGLGLSITRGCGGVALWFAQRKARVLHYDQVIGRSDWSSIGFG